MGALRLFMDWNGFAHISQSPKSISYAELAEKLDAEERLVQRIGWALTLRGIVKPVGVDRITDTEHSKEFQRKKDWGAWFRMACVSMLLKTMQSKKSSPHAFTDTTAIIEPLFSGASSLPSTDGRNRSMLPMATQHRSLTDKRINHSGKLLTPNL